MTKDPDTLTVEQKQNLIERAEALDRLVFSEQANILDMARGVAAVVSHLCRLLAR